MSGGNGKFLCFACHWGGYAAADLAGVKGRILPDNIRIIRVLCTGMVDPTTIVKALRLGFVGVALVGCQKGECRYETGNYFANNRVEWIKLLLKQVGINPDRVFMGYANSENPDSFNAVVEPMIQKATALGAVGESEKLASDEVQARLELVEKLLATKELRWCIGQEVNLMSAGKDCFGEPFDVVSFRNKVMQIVERNIGRVRVLKAAGHEGKPLPEISKATGRDTKSVLDDLVMLVAKGLAELTTIGEDRYPVFKTLQR